MIEQTRIMQLARLHSGARKWFSRCRCVQSVSICPSSFHACLHEHHTRLDTDANSSLNHGIFIMVGLVQGCLVASVASARTALVGGKPT